MKEIENYFSWPETNKDTLRSVGQKWETEDWHTSPMMDIGIWYLIGGSDDKNPLNGMVKQINPLFATKYIGLPQNAKKLAEVFPDRSKFVAADWFEFFQYHVRFSLDWLQPTRLVNTGDQFNPDTNLRPLLYFLAPHGRIGDSRHYFDHYTLIRCKERGLDHLVDGYYESIRYLRSMGINVVTHVGSPDNHNDCNRIKPEYKDIQLDALINSRQAAALDTAALYKTDTETFRIGEALWANKIPCGIEGTPEPNCQWLKAKNPYTVNVVGDNFIERIYPGFQKNKNFPLAGTQQFKDVYGDRRWFLKLEFGAWKATDGTHGSPDGDEAAKRKYFDYFRSRIKELRQLIPNCKVLLPHGFDIRCAALNIPPSYFLS